MPGAGTTTHIYTLTTICYSVPPARQTKLYSQRIFTQPVQVS